MRIKTFIRLFPSKQSLIVLILAVLVFAFGVWFINYHVLKTHVLDDVSLKGSDIEKQVVGGQLDESASLQSSVKDKNRENIYVYIAGEVKNPGVVKVKQGTRLFECLEKIGGVNDNADLISHNLAVEVKDGDKFIFAPKNSSSTPVTNTNNGLVSINNASKDELDSLEGIGEKIATRIIKYREKHGGFKSVEEIKMVQGIGQFVFEKIKDSITL